MLLIHGHYKLWRKPVGFRNAYCHHCKCCTRQLQYRYFMVGHLFWIPLLPLGFWREWRCNQCERDPAPALRRPFYWALLVLPMLIGFSGWTLPVDAARPALSWGMRLIAPAGALLLVYLLLRRRRVAQHCAPADEKNCPVCSSPMLLTSPPQCSSCGVRQY